MVTRIGILCSIYMSWSYSLLNDYKSCYFNASFQYSCKCFDFSKKK